MDPVKNAGVNDYTMSMPQQNEVQTMPEENYSSMPMVYDPTLEEKKESASSGLALKALGAIGLAGLAFWGGHAWGSKGAKLAEEAKDAAVKAKDAAVKAKDEAVKAKDAAVKAKDEALAKAKKLQDANDATREILEAKYTEGFWNKGKLRKESLEALGPKENEAKKVTEEVAEGAKKAEGEVKPEAKPETKADGAEKTEKKDGE